MNSRTRVFGVPVDALDSGQAIARLHGWLDEPQTGRYVVTPNVDHVCKLSRDPMFQEAYEGAGLVLVDGTPVLWAARWLGEKLPSVVTGSDLTPALFASADSRGGMRVFLLGAGPGVAQSAASEIKRRWPFVSVCGTYCPPLGFEEDPLELKRIEELLVGCQPEVLVVGLGAPKQELWAYRFRDRNPARVTLCVGATIDFLASNAKRAPPWLRGTGLEWLHRLASEPRRLGPRYFKDALQFPRLVWKEWRQRRRNSEPVSQDRS